MRYFWRRICWELFGRGSWRKLKVLLGDSWRKKEVSLKSFSSLFFIIYNVRTDMLQHNLHFCGVLQLGIMMILSHLIFIIFRRRHTKGLKIFLIVPTNIEPYEFQALSLQIFSLVLWHIQARVNWEILIEAKSLRFTLCLVVCRDD